MAATNTGQQELFTLPLHLISLRFQQELMFLFNLSFPCCDLPTILFWPLPIVLLLIYYFFVICKLFLN
jgi:hypothetical protein